LIEIEIVAGSAPGLEAPSKKEAAPRSPLRFSIPEEAQGYPLRKLIEHISAIDTRVQTVILDPDTGRLRWNAIAVLNGTHVDLLRGLDTPVRVGDRLLLVPFMDGG
jgi:molybdopterin converting factor small subunit